MIADPTRKRRAMRTAGIFIGVGLFAWLLAMGSSRVLSVFLAIPEGEKLTSLSLDPGRERGPDEPRPPVESGSSPRAGLSRGRDYYVSPVIDRNIFDSSLVGVKAGPGALEPGDDVPKSDLKVVLLATMVAIPEEYSSALIAEDKGKSKASGYGLHDSVLGEAEIVAIEQRRVLVRRSDGSVEAILMGVDGGTRSASAAKEPGGTSDEADGVSKDGENKFVVDRALVDSIIADPEKLYSQVRVVPHKGVDGDVDGYRMSGIRRTSVFSKLGIKNGDIVHAVNGKPLTSVSAAMEAYNSLQSSSNFSFDLTRRNQKQTFEYEIR